MSTELSLLTKHVKRGNSKIGDDTLITNMGSATDCPSRKLGLCQLCGTLNKSGKREVQCYAQRDEVQYPSVLPYRRRQEKLWKNSTAQDYADTFFGIIRRSRTKTQYVRINESGDFHCQEDVEKVKDIARALPVIKFYMYTARRDLSFAGLPENLCINGSGFKRGKMNEFRAVPEYSGKNPRCAGDCRKCNLCKTAKGIVIENKYH